MRKKLFPFNKQRCAQTRQKEIVITGDGMTGVTTDPSLNSQYTVHWNNRQTDISPNVRCYRQIDIHLYTYFWMISWHYHRIIKFIPWILLYSVHLISSRYQAKYWWCKHLSPIKSVPLSNSYQDHVLVINVIILYSYVWIESMSM